MAEKKCFWKIHNFINNDPKIKFDLSKCSSNDILHVPPCFQTRKIICNVV